MAARCWDERGDDSDEIVVHVSRVSKGLSGGSHHCRNLDFGRRRKEEGKRDASVSSSFLSSRRISSPILVPQTSNLYHLPPLMRTSNTQTDPELER